jgi:hypothetical protein
MKQKQPKIKNRPIRIKKIEKYRTCIAKKHKSMTRPVYNYSTVVTGHGDKDGYIGEITGVMPTVHDSVRACGCPFNYSHPPGKANRVARTSGSAAGLTQRSRKSYAHEQVLAFSSAI